MMKVLVVDDSEEILEIVTDLLEKEGLVAIQARNGQEGLNLHVQHKPDFICLDVMMPDMTGYDVCREIRKIDAHTPIVFLSSNAEPYDKIRGLELGADDYIVKPFNIGELLARIRAVTRRCIFKSDPEHIDDSFKMHDLTVYPNQLVAERDGKKIDLSLREMKILQLLYSNKNRVVSREDLLAECWGEHIASESRTIDLHISKLRKRIELDPQDPQIVETVHGAGYRFRASL